jgi:hypothetical protein
MRRGRRLFVAGTVLVAAGLLWVSLVRAQHVPQQLSISEFRHTELREPLSAVMHRNLVGLPIYSADGARIGEITAVEVSSDGRIEAVQAEFAYALGLGTNSLVMRPDDLELRDNYVELPMQADEFHAVLTEQRR